MIPTIEIPEGKHSDLGPSSAKRWMNCPGSVLLTKDMPGESSVFADEGTAAHSLSEWCRREGVSAAKYLGYKLVVKRSEKSKRAIVVSPEMVKAIDEFVAYVNAIPGFPLYEPMVSYDLWVPGGFGTSDDIRLANWVTITDLKFGEGVKVFAKDNEQMKLYALGVVQCFGWLQEMKGFTLIIHQPRLNHIDKFDITLPDLVRWGNVATARALETTRKNAPIVAGEWCQFCKARKVCDTRKKWVATVGPSATTIDNAGFEDLDSPW